MRYPSFCKDTMNILISQEKWGIFNFIVVLLASTFLCSYLCRQPSAHRQVVELQA